MNSNFVLIYFDMTYYCDANNKQTIETNKEV